MQRTRIPRSCGAIVEAAPGAHAAELADALHREDGHGRERRDPPSLLDRNAVIVAFKALRVEGKANAVSPGAIRAKLKGETAHVRAALKRLRAAG